MAGFDITAATSALDYDHKSHRLFVGLGSGLVHVSLLLRQETVNSALLILKPFTRFFSPIMYQAHSSMFKPAHTYGYCYL